MVRGALKGSQEKKETWELLDNKDLRVKEDPKGMRVGQVPHPILYILSFLFINKKNRP